MAHIVFNESFGTLEIVEKGKVVFEGTSKEIIDLIKDAQSMAESIQMDLDAENIEDIPEIAYEQYVHFANKYKR